MKNISSAHEFLREKLVESTLSQYDFNLNFDDKNSESGYGIYDYLKREYEKGNLCFKTYEEFMCIVGEYHEKYNMMHVAKKNALDSKENFEMTQNMEWPCLFGEDETRIRFYVESMILFTRAALDYAAGIFSCYFLTYKTDSFNKLRKQIIKDKTKYTEIAESLVKDEINVIELLCGNEKGRALRDQIAHKGPIKLEYLEYKDGSEKERLYISINNKYIVFEEFLSSFCIEAEYIIDCFEKYIKEKRLKPKCDICQEKMRCVYRNEVDEMKLLKE